MGKVVQNFSPELVVDAIKEVRSAVKVLYNELGQVSAPIAAEAKKLEFLVKLEEDIEEMEGAPAAAQEGTQEKQPAEPAANAGPEPAGKEAPSGEKEKSE